jgi:hypothetical protein
VVCVCERERGTVPGAGELRRRRSTSSSAAERLRRRLRPLRLGQAMDARAPAAARPGPDLGGAGAAAPGSVTERGTVAGWLARSRAPSELMMKKRDESDGVREWGGVCARVNSHAWTGRARAEAAGCGGGRWW